MMLFIVVLTRQNIPSLFHPSVTEDMAGSGRLYHMKKFENRCHRTDGFLAFVHPPSSTLGAHWIDDSAPPWAG